MLPVVWSLEADHARQYPLISHIWCRIPEWHWHGLQTSDAGKVELSQKNLTINWWQETDGCNVMVHSGSNSQFGSATNMACTFWGLTESVLWQVGVGFVLYEGQTAYSLHSLHITAVLCDWSPTLTYIVTSFRYKLKVQNTKISLCLSEEI